MSKHDIDDLIGKVLTGEASPDERTHLEDWVRQGPDNLRYLEQMRLVYERAGTDPGQLQVDVEAAWQKVKSRLRTQSRGGLVGLWPALRVAAGVAVIITAGWITWQWVNTPEQVVLASTERTVVDTLPDGSQAFLNKRTKLEFSYNKRTGERTARLQGEGYFTIRHDETKPFVIEAGGVFVKDLGTAFNVNASPDSPVVEVLVSEGEVAFYSSDNPGLRLIAGESGVFDKTTRTFSRVEKADTNKIAYKTRIFRFNNTSLGDAVELIGEVYGVDVRLDNEQLKACSITVNFNNEDIDTVLDILAETMGLTLQKQGEVYVLTGAGCAHE